MVKIAPGNYEQRPLFVISCICVPTLNYNQRRVGTLREKIIDGVRVHQVLGDLGWNNCSFVLFSQI
jgi:hypothetical protein